MKTTTVIVRWSRGLHLRAAAQLVRLTQGFHSRIQLEFESAVADAGSVLSLVLLSAGLNTPLKLQVVGEDEHEAMAALQRFFDNPAEEDEPADRASEPV